MAGRLNTILGLDTTEFQRGLIQATAKLDAFAKRAQSMGQTLTQNLTVPLVGIGAAAVKSFADFEKLENSLTAVMGSSEAAKNEMIALRKVAENPGLALPEVVKASARLQSVGISADEARQTITEFGNAVARASGGADVLDGVVLALTQISAAGKVTQEDLNQIKERLPEFGRVMQEEFGVTTAEGIRALGISSEEFIQRSTKALSGLERANGGLSNSFDNFRDSVQGSLAQLGSAINEAFNLESVLASVSKAIQSVADWFDRLSPQVQKGIIYFAAFAAAIGPVLFIVGKLAGAFEFVAKGLDIVGKGFKLLTSPVGLTVLAIAGAVVIVAKLYNEFEGVRRVINGVGNGFVELAKLAKQSFANILAGINAVKEGDFKGAAEAFGKALVIVNPAELGKTFAVGFSQGFADTRNYLKPTIEGIKKDIQAATKGIMTATGLGGGVSPISAGVGSGAQPDTEVVTRTAPIANFAQLENNIPLVQRFGAEIEALAEKNSGLTATFDELGIKINTSASASLSTFAEKVAAAKAEFQALQDTQWVGVIESSFNILGSALGGAIENVQNFGKAVKRAFLDILGVVVNEIILYQIRNFLASPAGVALGPLAGPIALGAGKALGAVVKGLLGSVKLAKGGLAYGPTLATVGDNPNAISDPEVIAPLSKLKDLLGNTGGGYIAETRISGSDLLILVSNAERRNNRIR